MVPLDSDSLDSSGIEYHQAYGQNMANTYNYVAPHLFYDYPQSFAALRDAVTKPIATQ